MKYKSGLRDGESEGEHCMLVEGLVSGASLNGTRLLRAAASGWKGSKSSKSSGGGGLLLLTSRVNRRMRRARRADLGDPSDIHFPLPPCIRSVQRGEGERALGNRTHDRKVIFVVRENPVASSVPKPTIRHETDVDKVGYRADAFTKATLAATMPLPPGPPPRDAVQRWTDHTHLTPDKLGRWKRG